MRGHRWYAAAAKINVVALRHRRTGKSCDVNVICMYKCETGFETRCRDNVSEGDDEEAPGKACVGKRH